VYAADRVGTNLVRDFVTNPHGSKMARADKAACPLAPTRSDRHRRKTASFLYAQFAPHH